MENDLSAKTMDVFAAMLRRHCVIADRLISSLLVNMSSLLINLDDSITIPMRDCVYYAICIACAISFQKNHQLVIITCINHNIELIAKKKQNPREEAETSHYCNVLETMINLLFFGIVTVATCVKGASF